MHNWFNTLAILALALYLVRSRITKFHQRFRSMYKTVEFGFREKCVKAATMRWLDFILLTFVTTFTVVCFDSWFQVLRLSPKLTQILYPKFDEWLILAAIVLVLIVFAYPFAKFMRLRYVTTLRSYPPTWLSILIAFVFIALVLHFDFWDVFWTSVLLLSVVITIGTLDYLLSVRTGSSLSQDNSEMPTNANISENMDALFEWVNNDFPIDHPLNDVFGISDKAKATARMIASNEFKSLGVIGEFGVGKTSFINLVEFHLLHGEINRELYDQRKSWSLARFLLGIPPVPRFLFVRAEMWGLLSDSAEKFVLSAVINSLSRYADCLQITSIPQKYAELVRGDGLGLLSAIIHFSGSGSPLEQLQRLEPILSACNIRLIIVVEDLDRNIGRPSISYNQNAVTNVPSSSIEFQTSLTSAPAKDKLTEFQALLDAVKKVDGLSFIFCSGPAR